MSCHTYEQVVARRWMSHVAHMKESCRIYVMSHIWTSCGAQMNKSCHTYEGVMSHICHVTHMNKLWRADEWVMSHIWRSHVAYMSCHTYEQVVARRWMCIICVIRLIHRHNLFMCVKWLIHMHDVLHMNESPEGSGRAFMGDTTHA